MAMTGSDLRCRVELLQRTPGENELGERTYTYQPVRKFWAEIVPTTGRRETLDGDMERVEITHRVSCRRAALPDLTTDMRLRFRGQDYAVQHFYPNYKRTGWLDIFVKLVVENGVQSY